MRPTTVRYTTYPAIVLGGSTLLIASRAAGWGYWPLAPIILILAAVLVAILERVQPYAPAWNVDDGDGRLDLLHLIGNVALSQISLVIFAALRPICSGVGIWPDAWPFWAEALLALAVVDLGLYAIHRASHGLGWLWRLHTIHHSSRRVYWVNGSAATFSTRSSKGRPESWPCSSLAHRPRRSRPRSRS